MKDETIEETKKYHMQMKHLRSLSNLDRLRPECAQRGKIVIK